MLLADRDAVRSAYPQHADAFEQRGVRAVAVLPMLSTARVVIGAVGFEWARRMTFDDATTSTMLTAPSPSTRRARSQ